MNNVTRITLNVGLNALSGGQHMGKGDRRSKRGKIWRGTSGVSRPKKKKTKDKKK